MSEPVTERFLCAPGLRLQAHERVTEIQNANILQRLDRVDEMMERLERRLWLTVYGIIAMILGQAVQSILVAAP
ncbi:MAG: hypothetical protein AAF636_03385 [Pseudomonadota bacterium]